MVKLLKEPIADSMKGFLYLALVLVGLVSQPLLAHQMKQHTSQVTVRDGQVEVVLHLDGDKWFAKLADHHSWLLGDTEMVIDESLAAEAKIKKIETLLRQEIQLRVNKQQVPLTIEKLSYYDSLLHLRVLLLASSKVSSVEVKEVALKYPKSLGQVYTSIAKPQYKLATADKQIEFQFN